MKIFEILFCHIRHNSSRFWIDFSPFHGPPPKLQGLETFVLENKSDDFRERRATAHETGRHFHHFGGSISMLKDSRIPQDSEKNIFRNLPVDFNAVKVKKIKEDLTDRRIPFVAYSNVGFYFFHSGGLVVVEQNDFLIFLFFRHNFFKSPLN